MANTSKVQAGAARKPPNAGKGRPAQVLDGPGTYRVVRPNISAHGVDVGVYSET